MIREVVLVSPRGFCAGVVRAVATVERALANAPAPVYVRGPIVHNAYVVARLAAAGARFVRDLDEVPLGSVVVFSAHGVPPSVWQQGRDRQLRIVDATCPLVSKVHREVRRLSELGFELLLVGEGAHDEVIGTMGQAPNVHLVEPYSDVRRVRVRDPARVACVMQTTLSPQETTSVTCALRRRFPSLIEPKNADVCYATRNRQAAASWLAKHVDLVLVVGDESSSNSRRLVATVQKMGTAAHLIPSVARIQNSWLAGAEVVGVTAGASTPEALVQQVVAYLRGAGADVRQEVFADERVVFRLPRELTALSDTPAAAERSPSP